MATARHRTCSLGLWLVATPLLLGAGLSPLGAQVEDPIHAEVRRTIGQIDGRVTLTGVSHLVVVGDRIYAAQPIEKRIRVLSLDGRPLAFIGGGGDGPGEFRRIDFLGAMDSTLVVVDLGLRRETRFALDGSVANTRRLPSVPSTPPVSFIAPIYPAVQNRTVVYGTVPVRVSPADFPYAPGVLVDESGTILDTVPSLRNGDRAVVILGSGGRNFTFTRPIHDAAAYAMSSNGRYLAVADRLGEQVVVKRYDTDSRSTTVIETGLPNAPVPAQVADSVEAALVERTLAARPQLGRRAIERAMAIPRTVMGADQITVLPSGEMWLRRPDFDSGPDTWLALTPDGSARAQVEVPDGLRLLARDGSSLWGVRQDELGVTYIVQLEVKLPWN